MSLDSISCVKGLCTICDLGNNCNTQILANCLWKSYLHVQQMAGKDQFSSCHCSSSFLRQCSGRRGSAEAFPECGIQESTSTIQM